MEKRSSVNRNLPHGAEKNGGTKIVLEEIYHPIKFNVSLKFDKKLLVFLQWENLLDIIKSVERTDSRFICKGSRGTALRETARKKGTWSAAFCGPHRGEIMIKTVEIGRNVKKYRKQKGLTQVELAKRVGISKIHMSHVESGVVSMSMECMLRLCEQLNITPNHLLLADHQIQQDRVILREAMDGLTAAEIGYVVKTIDLLKAMKINRKEPQKGD